MYGSAIKLNGAVEGKVKRSNQPGGTK